jgi:hypothetical protein
VPPGRAAGARTVETPAARRRSPIHARRFVRWSRGQAWWALANPQNGPVSRTSHRTDGSPPRVRRSARRMLPPPWTQTSLGPTLRDFHRSTPVRLSLVRRTSPLTRSAPRSEIRARETNLNTRYRLEHARSGVLKSISRAQVGMACSGWYGVLKLGEDGRPRRPSLTSAPPHLRPSPPQPHPPQTSLTSPRVRGARRRRSARPGPPTPAAAGCRMPRRRCPREGRLRPQTGTALSRW